MAYSTGQRLSTCLLAALAFASPSLVRGREGELAPVIDVNPRHTAVVPQPSREPNAFVVAADAMSLLPETDVSVVPLAKPRHTSSTQPNQSQRQPAVRYTAPFDPSQNAHSRQESRFAQGSTATLAPVIRVYEPIRDAPQTPVHNSVLPRRDPLLVTSVTSKPTLVLKLVEETLPERLIASEVSSLASLSTEPATPIIQLAEAEPLLAVLQASPSASDLPAPMQEPGLAAEQVAEAEDIESFDLDLKPIGALSARTKPEAGELPKNYAAARFAREGKVAQRMGFSRLTTEMEMTWEAPAICHRPLYFEDINLERHGYKVPLIQPAISAAHFFGRVPLLPYMMVSEGHRDCQYTLGHYRPGDYAPYSLYVPRLRLDASAAEVAVVASILFAFP